MKTDEEIKQIAKEAIENRIYIAETEEKLENSFKMILTMLDDKSRKNMLEDQPAAFYEYYDKAGPRSVNGFPQFFSFRYLNLEEWKKFCGYHKEMTKVIEAIE